MCSSYVAIGVTLLAIIGFVVEGSARLIDLAGAAGWVSVAELVVGRSLFGFFMFSALVYQLTRVGYLIRFSAHRAASDSELECVYRRIPAPRVTILVPSYKEETRVVRQTLLAAALQHFPSRRIVLLIDDPPTPRNREDAAKLAATRNLPRELEALFVEPCRRFEEALAGYMMRRADGSVDLRPEVERVVAALREAAEWLDGLADATVVRDHTDALFVERILRAPARAHRARAGRLEALRDPARADLLLEYRRLATLFKIEITSFERKRYANLSHECNKAMNLNGYLTLIGKSFREVVSQDGRVLEPSSGAQATLRVPDADFIVVLDADSLILAEYSLRLVHFMTRPGNERVAVVQTPYASVPGAPSTIERIAGATTDVQLMAHQGATLFGAGSWVGASALVRRAALDNIVFMVEERGYSVPCYVRDRTLNEDTDTSVDLIRKGWTVHNYPDRLAYSATPPDFGSLLIQRRRWATGGLIILPNLVRYVAERPSFRRLWEGLMRAQYILSAPLGSIGAMALVLYPFPGRVWSVWPDLAFLAYLAPYARDLVHNGNRGPDLFRAMSLNAMLLPINLAGAVNSIRQLWTGRKIPFQRTPKVDGRTAATRLQIAGQFALFLLTGCEVPLRFVTGEWLAGLFFLSCTVAFGYALHAFIGWRAALEDLVGGVELRPLLPSRAVFEQLGPASMEADQMKTGDRSPAPVDGLRVMGVRARNAGLRALIVCFASLALGQAAVADIKQREAAVTFDDLPVISVMPLDAAGRRSITVRLLDAIGSNGVPAVGFVNEYGLYGFRPSNDGAADQDGVALLRLWLDAGLELGNHTFAHVDLHKTSRAAYQDDIVRGEAVTGALMRERGLRLRYFRHPYLHTGRDRATKRDVERFLAARGYRVAPVTVDNEDHLFAAAYSRAAARGDKDLMRRVVAAYVGHTERVLEYCERLSLALFGRGIRQIVLLHANALNADHFDDLAQMMKRRGYSFVTLDDALRDEAYGSADTYTGEESIDWLARWALTKGIRTLDEVLDDVPDVPEFVVHAADGSDGRAPRKELEAKLPAE